MTIERDYTFFDKCCLGIDNALKTLSNQAKTTGKAYPATDLRGDNLLSANEMKQAAGLMRVNHAGEVAAQALYHGQGAASASPDIKAKMAASAIEEGDHLTWCQKRLNELGSHTSYLNPVWYAGSFCIGMIAGMVGDKWSLGFVAETEKQVIKHLEDHLNALPAKDIRSQQILAQMQKDEAHHREEAIALGAETLSPFTQQVMSLVAKVMVKTSYWI